MEAAAAPQHGGANGVIDLDEAGSGSGGGAPLSPPLSPASAAAAALANARWNPTKEQLAALEGLYEHGLRTPTAEQIKQITARLREHGHIEGKNVFYWFQNHKARQRQKLKQDNFAYFTRLLRRPPPLPVLVRPPGPLPPPYPHGRLPVPATPSSLAVATPPPAAAAAAAAACSNTSGGMHVMYRAPAFYMPAPPQAPAPNALYYHHHPQQQQQQVQAPVMYPRMEVAQDQMIQAAAQHNHHHHRRRRHHNPAAGAMYHAAAAGSSASTAPMHVLHFPPAAAAATDAGPSRETLQLFPLQPTFLLPADKSMASTTASASFSGESESMEESPDSSGEALAVPFYDFFGLHSGGR